MNSYRASMALNPRTAFLIRREGPVGGKGELNEDRGRDWRDAAKSQGMPRKRQGGEILSGTFRGSTALSPPWFPRTRLQNCGRTSLCCSKPPSSRYFVAAAWQGVHLLCALLPSCTAPVWLPSSPFLQSSWDPPCSISCLTFLSTWTLENDPLLNSSSIFHLLHLLGT